MDDGGAEEPGNLKRRMTLSLRLLDLFFQKRQLFIYCYRQKVCRHLCS